MSLTKAYNAIIDWNACHLGSDYEAIDQKVLQPIFDIIPDEWNLEEGHWIEAYLQFCPKCGCIETRTTDNMASYPEAYYKTLCRHCDFLISMVDNSPCCVWYQYKEDGYEVSI